VVVVSFSMFLAGFILLQSAYLNGKKMHFIRFSAGEHHFWLYDDLIVSIIIFVFTFANSTIVKLSIRIWKSIEFSLPEVFMSPYFDAVFSLQYSPYYYQCHHY
jgi:hypothetical protein